MSAKNPDFDSPLKRAQSQRGKIGGAAPGVDDAIASQRREETPAEKPPPGMVKKTRLLHTSVYYDPTKREDMQLWEFLKHDAIEQRMSMSDLMKQIARGYRDRKTGIWSDAE